MLRSRTEKLKRQFALLIAGLYKVLVNSLLDTRDPCQIKPFVETLAAEPAQKLYSVMLLILDSLTPKLFPAK